MPNLQPTDRYYPRLSEIVTVDDLPDFLSSVQSGLDTAFENVFGKIRYKNLQYSKSARGDSAFYALDIVTRESIRFEIAEGMAFVLNPDADGNTELSSFPVTVEYQWEILAFLRTFSLEGFSFSPVDFFKLGLQVFRITDAMLLAHTMNYFVEPDDETITKPQQLLLDLNDYLDTLGIPQLELPANTEPSAGSIATAMKVRSDLDAAAILLFFMYIDSDDPDETRKRLQQFYNIVVPDGIESYIRKLITPSAKATLTLNAGIEFPRDILKPVHADGSEIPNAKSIFVFGEAVLKVDTKEGIGYQLDLGGSLLPEGFAEIGNSGLLLQLDGLKLDLSRTRNIPEADADGRPSDFRGVYARAVSVTLPKRWFHDNENLPNTSTTLRLGAYDLLVGTGGVSGKFALETVPNVNNTGQITDYFSDKFTLRYPVTVFERQPSGTLIEKEIADLPQLVTFLNAQERKSSATTFKFPIRLTHNSQEKVFTDAVSYQKFLAGLFDNTDPAAGGNTNILWKRLGGENGFAIGFEKFDITFKQNKVIGSNIAGFLQINRFKYPTGHPLHSNPVHINVQGHLYDNGGFELTASSDVGLEMEIPGAFMYSMTSLKLGKNDDGDYFIGTSGKIYFRGLLEEILDIKYIEINGLKVYSDGAIEFEEGSIVLTSPKTLDLGPVKMTISAIHYGMTRMEEGGHMHKFAYFGFDGGVKIDPFGLEVRGDGVKFYYCVDDSSIAPKLRIKTLYIDLTVPANTKFATIKGWVTIPQPGESEFYQGSLSVEIPSAKLSGMAEIDFRPKYPAFYLDTRFDFATPIPLGPISMYGFQGLLGYRYLAAKEGVTPTAESWYAYYKAPRLGMNRPKFLGPEKTAGSGTPVSIGAGASLGTTGDDGFTFNVKALALLSIPSMFMLDGRANILSARTGLSDTSDPPFFAMLIIGDHSVEFGFGADFKRSKERGEMIKVYGEVQAGFFFNDSSKWYINIGTKEKPLSSRVLSLATMQAFVMMSAKGIEAGARAELNFNRKYGIIKVKAWAFIEVGGRISFERAQMGAYLQAEVGARVSIKWFRLGLTVGILFAVEAPKPYRIFGKFYYRVHLRVLFFSFSFKGYLEVLWEGNKTVDRSRIDPVGKKTKLANQKRAFKAISMQTGEAFALAYPNSANPSGAELTDIMKTIIPLDTYIDFNTEKGLIPLPPGQSIIGGFTNPPARYVDLIPPDKTIKGKTLRRVRHEYSIQSVTVQSYNPNLPAGQRWVTYNPYTSMYPNDVAGTQNLKAGQYQKIGSQYSAVRLLGTAPFSYTELGQPGWYTPEQNGFANVSLFCEGEQVTMKKANFEEKPLGQQYNCPDVNTMFFSNQVAFFLVERYLADHATVVDDANLFDTVQSLAFPSHAPLEIILPDPSVKILLKLTGTVDGLRIKFFAALIDDDALEVPFGHPDPNHTPQDEPYEIIQTDNDGITITYEQPAWRPVVKIRIETLYPNIIAQQVNDLEEQIAQMQEWNDLIELGLETGEIVSTFDLEQQLSQLLCSGGRLVTSTFEYNFGANEYRELAEGQWLNSWDENVDGKYAGQHFGFKLNTTIFEIESDYQIFDVKLYPIDANMPPFGYVTETDGTHAQISVTSFAEYDQDHYRIEITYYETGAGCGVEEPVLCAFYEELLEQFETLILPEQANAGTEYASFGMVFRMLKTLVKVFENNHPQYAGVISEPMATQLNTTTAYNNSASNYPGCYDAYNDVLIFINGLGNCLCECTDIPENYILFHEIGWVSQDDYQFNELIPDQLAIQEEVSQSIEALTNYIQPIWRPDTSYLVTFTLKDEVEGATVPAEPFVYRCGFTTSGPLGYYHLNTNVPDIDQSKYEDYPLASLSRYIDYRRSYPDFRGNLLDSKPMFFNDVSTEIFLFFSKTYVVNFFRDWDAYQGRESKGKLKMILKDPTEGLEVVNPPALDVDATITDVPQSYQDWVADEAPQIPASLSQYSNLYEFNSCSMEGQTIIPKSQYVVFQPKHLKPSKLYTAIIANVYSDGATSLPAHPNEEQYREVYRFVFQTSRYASLEQQVQSFFMQEEHDGTVYTKEALFDIYVDLKVAEVSALYKIVSGQAITGLNTEAIDFIKQRQDRFDQALEGLLQLSPLQPAICTEINVIRNGEDGPAIALLVRNPEPFSPKLPASKLIQALEVLIPVASLTPLENRLPDRHYKVLFSKDRSQAIIMNSNATVPDFVELRFRLFIPDGGNTYPQKGPATGLEFTI